ncbi:uncharacterized protein K489DRAFT_370040 [Dissoconium aciculare CBS 342.82]|uniref:Nascent polypeptide-associated complex subunit alpha-like UBA domain-containing protein n=1 Tax=Dissoconium aciculare CBS 342.82 TaxID=1314786 RepID=A0A6J3M6T0_9PEZI|nr:uncharacterized protein K489DRAFT_370040 [Dissoconium aciculare CBS 342.82]KAF1823720.1 hypothetical protein K489DRAFT_370040 [Dissoconium aciculare CBS 342.82]
MAEPQPSNVKEGSDQPDVLPANAEDRKAAQAMSSLDVRGDDDGNAPKKEADLKALGEALKSLDVNQAQQKRTEIAKKEEAPKKVIKVDPTDVSLLAEQLDLSKTKATDLLRAHDADVVKALTAWVWSKSRLCVNDDQYQDRSHFGGGPPCFQGKFSGAMPTNLQLKKQKDAFPPRRQ